MGRSSAISIWVSVGGGHKELVSEEGWDAVQREGNKTRKGREPATQNGTGRRPGSTFWLVTRCENGGMEVHTIGSDGEVLPLFSFEEEAEMFLRLGALRESWQARETTVGELISVLYGPCVSVKRVALDPWPARACGEARVGLVSLLREDFTRKLVDENRFRLYAKACYLRRR